MAGLVPEDAHAPLRGAAFDLEHLVELKLGQSWMEQLEGNGDPGNRVRGEPLIRQPDMRSKEKVLGFQLALKLTELFFNRTAIDVYRLRVQSDVQQPLISPRNPLRVH